MHNQPEGLHEFTVETREPSGQHRMTRKAFNEWLRGSGRTPAEAALKGGSRRFSPMHRRRIAHAASYTSFALMAQEGLGLSAHARHHTGNKRNHGDL